MMDKKILSSLKKKFRNVHPLIFQRSLEKSNTPGELFDVLDTLPKQYPIIWDEKERRWATVTDMYQTASFLSITEAKKLLN